MAADGMVRVRCKVCRKDGVKDGYTIHKSKDVRCKHKSIVFQGIYPIPGTNKQDVKSFQTKELADDFRAQKRIEYCNDPNPRKRQRTFFKQLKDQYIEKKRKSSSVGPKAFSNYVQIIETHIGKPLDHLDMDFITPKIAQAVRDAVEGKSDSLRQKVNSHLNGIFSMGKLYNLIDKSPTENLEKLRAGRRTKYKFLEREGVRSLLDTPKNLFHKLYYGFSLFFGLRSEEIVGLPIDCINLDRNEIDVRQAVIRLTEEEMIREKCDSHWLFKDTKTAAGDRKIPIPDSFRKDLEIFLIQRPENKYNLLFASENGEPVNHANLRTRHFYPDLKRAGLPKMHFHELRHTFCSLSFAAGIDEGLIQYYMGHDDSEVTRGIYRHLTEEQKRKGAGFAKKMDQMIYPESIRVNAVSMDKR